MNELFRFCPRCGAPLADKEVFGRLRRHCRYCGYTQFRDPKVAVAALVSKDRQVLLVRRGVIPAIGSWALPAGHVDFDESPEVALIREVDEETGIRIASLALLRVAPMAGWKQPRGILLIYAAEESSGMISAGDDVSEAAWFSVDEIPWESLAFESTTQILREWVTSVAPATNI